MRQWLVFSESATSLVYGAGPSIDPGRIGVWLLGEPEDGTEFAKTIIAMGKEYEAGVTSAGIRGAFTFALNGATMPSPNNTLHIDRARDLHAPPTSDPVQSPARHCK